MKDTCSISIVAVSIVLLGSPSVLSADRLRARCDELMAKYNAADRDLVSARPPHIFSGSYTYDRRPTAPLSLGYVVPTTQYSSGVFIVKSRHTILATSSGTTFGNSIRVERESYPSPCSKKQIDAYGDDVTAERYIDYHFYGLRDSTPGQNNLDRAQADVGMRPNPSFWSLSAKERCLNTRDTAISVQFLYDDQQHDPSVRRAATVYETLQRQKALFSGAIGRKSPYDAPKQYFGYDVMKTEVIPYQRVANTRRCYMFEVAIPPNAKTTEVMVVDADDAAGGGRDPQNSLLINWSEPASSYVASIHR